MIIAETVIPLSVLSTHIRLSFYAQIKLVSEIFHVPYAKIIICEHGHLAPPMGQDAHMMGILPQWKYVLYCFVINSICVNKE